MSRHNRNSDEPTPDPVPAAVPDTPAAPAPDDGAPNGLRAELVVLGKRVEDRIEVFEQTIRDWIDRRSSASDDNTSERARPYPGAVVSYFDKGAGGELDEHAAIIVKTGDDGTLDLFVLFADKEAARVKRVPPSGESPEAGAWHFPSRG